MKKSNKTKGFTLLELLLVVGIAAILIVAGITTYNLVTRGNQVNEAVRLVNTLVDQTRRLYSSQNTYGAASNNIEVALYNAGSVPSRYLGGAGVITSPFSSAATAVAVTGHATAGQFTVSMAMPPNLVPEVVGAFNPAQSADIVSVAYCGATAVTGNIDPATVATACGSSTTIPTTANMTVVFR